MCNFAELVETHGDALLQRWVNKGPAWVADSPRRRFGFDVQALVREYGLLGGVLL